MTAPVPIPTIWTGEAFAPLEWFRARADKLFVVGQRYRLIELEERSEASNSHQFAWLHDAWQNLPENLQELYPTENHLRKRALIQAGYFHEDTIDCSTNAAALRVAAYARGKDEFAFVTVRGPIVSVRTAKSQSRHAMAKDEFQASKTAIMEIVAEMIGVTPEQLKANAGRSA